jgi:cytochrome o ubiquinol oxidase operon protein cyoD
MADLKEYRVASAQGEAGSMSSYVSGFVISIALTLFAYAIVVNHWLSGYALIIVLIELAILQFASQLFLFLHFGKGKSANWRLLTLVLMLFFVLVVIIGSIWVMSSLNYNMSPSYIQEYMVNQVNSGF